MAELSFCADILSIIGAVAAIIAAFNTRAIKAEITSRLQLPKVFKSLSSQTDEMLPLLEPGAFAAEQSKRTIHQIINRMKSDVAQLQTAKTSPHCVSVAKELTAAIAAYEAGPEHDRAWEVVYKSQGLRQSITHLIDQRKIVG